MIVSFFNFIRNGFQTAREKKFPNMFSVNINLELNTGSKIIRKYRIDVAAHDKQHARRILQKELKVVIGSASRKL